MTKTLVFDLDGTIVDLYGVENWLDDLMNENPRPYVVANPIYNPITLNSILEMLKEHGWKIVVTTWLAKGSTKRYDNMVREAKLEWLDRHNFPYDEIHLVKYGTTKANCTRRHGGYQILIDDNEAIRKGWTLGDTIDANENILVALARIVAKEVKGLK